MSIQPKSIHQQVIVITGASSGIGLATARLLAKEGAKLVLVARSEEDLKKLADELSGQSKTAVYVAGDVADEAVHRKAADAAIREFGHLDTWINNAGAAAYGKIEDVPMEDNRRIFETNFWGTVIGSRVALEYLKKRDDGTAGMIINIGSVVSDRAIPLQGMYSASKHAVKGFTDALRVEVQESRLPVAVTLIKPSSIDTPYSKHAANYMDEEPKFPPPVYAPEVVARTILYCCEHIERELTVGGGGRMLAGMGRAMPGIFDKVSTATLFKGQKKGEPSDPNAHRGLQHAAGGLQERGGHEGHVMESSLYTTARVHPWMTGAAIVGGGLAVAAMIHTARPKPTLTQRARQLTRHFASR